MKIEFPKIEWDTRAMGKVDRASYAWRNNRGRGNRRREGYWSRQMWYWSGRAVGMTHKEAKKNLHDEAALRAAGH